MALIQVKPIDKGDKRLGLELVGLTRSPGAGFYIEALLDPTTKQRNTGLSVEDAERLGKVMGLDLTPKSDFWETMDAKVKLEDKTKVLDTDFPIDCVHLALLKASKYVAKSQTEYREGMAPDAVAVILNPDEEVKAQGAQFEKKKKAIAALDRMLPTKQKWFATSMFAKSYENLLPQAASNDLMSFMEQGNKNIDTFLRWIEKTDERIEAEYIIRLGIIYNVLRLSGGRVMRGDTELGYDILHTVDTLTSPSKQDIRMQIENEIASKLGVTFQRAAEPLKVVDAVETIPKEKITTK